MQPTKTPTVALTSDRFLPPNKKNAKLGNYLVIGFDTEYQRETVNQQNGGVALRNRVLSYQYSGLVLAPENDGAEQSWSGIVLPDGPADSDRLSIAEFVEQAVRDGLSQYPKLTLPSDVYLVAHFTRADVPGFRDFKDEQKRDAMNLENVRNLFVNIEKDIDLKLHADSGSFDISLNVKIRDTMALAPAGAKSLEKLGEILGFEKIKLSADPEQELYYKQNMSDLMKDDWDLFRDYAIRDAEICAQYTSKMVRLYFDKTGRFKLPITLTSIGVDLIQKFWKDRGVDPLKIVGKEQITEKYWSKRYGQYRTKRQVKPVKKLFWSEDFFTECYHGGRNEQFWFGPASEGVWYDYDLTSAYPSAMTLIGEPDWSSIRPILNEAELLNSDLLPVDLAFANVDFEFPESVRYPVLPVRTENGLIFPRKGNCTTHISEILLASRLGCKINLVEGRRIDSKRHGNQKSGIQPPNRPFDAFAKYCIEQRAKYPKKSLDNLFWKEVVNSTYGKTAQGLRERRIYDLRDAETKPLEPSKITNPVYAAFITAFCRGVLGEIMNSLPKQVKIFSVTTDGFLTTATDQQMQEAARHQLGRYYMSSRHRLTGDETTFEIKHIIRQPVGWRTRGQATLIQSDSEDWKETGIEPKEDERIVLAKGGIKLPAILSKREQNAEILKLFFDRKPTDTLVVTLGAGIREMYEQGIDFVDKQLTKRLSMEFDWKRRPASGCDATVDVSGIGPRTHLAFDTCPWDDVDQFNKVRGLWEQYNKDQLHCLKRVDDYQAFASFAESKLAAQGSAGTYLSKVDGELKRLRRDIVIAHKHRKAGTHVLKPNAFGRKNIFPTYKLKAAEFAEILADELGIPCSKSDVDNARKYKTFTPHQVPRTDTTVAKLLQIKRDLYPELDVEQLLTAEAPFDLHLGRTARKTD